MNTYGFEIRVSLTRRFTLIFRNINKLAVLVGGFGVFFMEENVESKLVMISSSLPILV